jgi:hypothetical protein
MLHGEGDFAGFRDSTFIAAQPIQHAPLVETVTQA